MNTGKTDSQGCVAVNHGHEEFTQANDAELVVVHTPSPSGLWIAHDQLKGMKPPFWVWMARS